MPRGSLCCTFVRGSLCACNRHADSAGRSSGQAWSAVLNNDVTAVILAGGRSSRFGSDKASARLGENTFLEHVVAACALVAPRAVVVLAPDQEPPPGAMRTLDFARDATPHEGPLAGVIAGLAVVGSPWGLVCSCDAPLVQPSLLALLASRRADGVEAVLPEVEGRIQPFPAVLAVSALSLLRDALDAGERRIGRALQQLRVAVVLEIELRAADPALLSFRNVNTAADLAALEAEGRHGGAARDG